MSLQIRSDVAINEAPVSRAPPTPLPPRGAAFFVAHSDTDKGLVREVKSAILRVARMRQVRDRWPHAARVHGYEVYFDEDSAADGRSLAGFSEAAAGAGCLIVLVPAGGVYPSSFIRKELLAFLTGIEHTTRAVPDPVSLTTDQHARAHERLGALLLVDVHGALTWDDEGLTGLTALCRTGVLGELFRHELPRLRETAQAARAIARAAIARLWGARPDDVVTAEEEHQRVRFWRWVVGLGAAAGLLGGLAVVALVQRREAQQQRRLTAEALRRTEEADH